MNKDEFGDVPNYYEGQKFGRCTLTKIHNDGRGVFTCSCGNVMVRKLGHFRAPEMCKKCVKIEYGQSLASTRPEDGISIRDIDDSEKAMIDKFLKEKAC